MKQNRFQQRHQFGIENDEHLQKALYNIFNDEHMAQLIFNNKHTVLLLLKLWNDRDKKIRKVFNNV